MKEGSRQNISLVSLTFHFLFFYPTSNKFREKIICNEALNSKICLSPTLTDELFFCSEMKNNFRNLFVVLIFWFFSIKRKEQYKDLDTLDTIYFTFHLRFKTWNISVQFVQLFNSPYFLTQWKTKAKQT